MSDPAAAPPGIPAPLNLSDTYGPILIGGNLSCAAWGVSCLQLFLYYTNYENDAIALKLFVFAVWFIDTVNEALVIASLWQVLIQEWAELSVTQPIALHRIWVASIVFAAVQIFFLSRIYRFTSGSRLKKAFIPILLTPFILWQTLSSIPYILWAYQDPSLATLSSNRNVTVFISLRSCSAFVDLTIAASMFYLLYKRRYSNFAMSKRMIHRLIVLSGMTGLWIAIVAIVDVFLMAAFKEGLQFCYLEYPFCSLYVNALLANLNARRYVTTGKGDVLQFNTFRDTTLNSMALRDLSSNGSSAPKTSSAMAIMVDTMQIVDNDDPADSVKAKDVRDAV